jgi:hypothetical protein
MWPDLDRIVATQLRNLVRGAVEDGVAGAALVDRHDRVIAVAGAIAEDEAMPLVALVLYRARGDELASRLFLGEILTPAIEGRDDVVAVAVAKRQLFVVATLDARSPALLERVAELRDDVARILGDHSDDAPPRVGGGGRSGSGPAELPVIELGITVPRTRGKA